jgi:hypothetical protein
MDEGLKNRAYLEGMRLKKSGMDDEIIRARLEKKGIPEDLIKNVIQNLNLKQQVEKKEEHQPMYYSGLIKVGLGVALAIISAIVLPGKIYLPIGFIVSGILYALIARQRMK